MPCVSFCNESFTEHIFIVQSIRLFVLLMCVGKLANISQGEEHSSWACIKPSSPLDGQTGVAFENRLSSVPTVAQQVRNPTSLHKDANEETPDIYTFIPTNHVLRF